MLDLGATSHTIDELKRKREKKKEDRNQQRERERETVKTGSCRETSTPNSRLSLGL